MGGGELRGGLAGVVDMGSRAGEETGEDLLRERDRPDVVRPDDGLLHGLVEADAEAAEQALAVEACGPRAVWRLRRSPKSMEAHPARGQTGRASPARVSVYPPGVIPFQSAAGPSSRATVVTVPMRPLQKGTGRVGVSGDSAVGHWAPVLAHRMEGGDPDRDRFGRPSLHASLLHGLDRRKHAFGCRLPTTVTLRFHAARKTRRGVARALTCTLASLRASEACPEAGVAPVAESRGRNVKS